MRVSVTPIRTPRPLSTPPASPPTSRPALTTTSTVSSPAITMTALRQPAPYGAAEKYAIPYNGEEVTLYWANYDQYYVKSGETFTDYRFQLPEGIGFPPAAVAFKLRAASVAQNNTKGDKRSFILAGDTPVAWDAAARVLTVGFEYRPLTDEKKWAGTQKQQAPQRRRGEADPCRGAGRRLLADRLGALGGRQGQERTAARPPPGALHRQEHPRLLHPQEPAALPRARAGLLPQERILPSRTSTGPSPASSERPPPGSRPSGSSPAASSRSLPRSRSSRSASGRSESSWSERLVRHA